LLHDVIITMGIFAWTGMEFDLTVVAALLTIVGYSLNDTIVVYDRIRETMPGEDKIKDPSAVALSTRRSTTPCREPC